MIYRGYVIRKRDGKFYVQGMSTPTLFQAKKLVDELIELRAEQFFQ